MTTLRGIEVKTLTVNPTEFACRCNWFKDLLCKDNWNKFVFALPRLDRREGILYLPKNMRVHNRPTAYLWNCHWVALEKTKQNKTKHSSAYIVEHIAFKER